jgi:hypothetical protein
MSTINLKIEGLSELKSSLDSNKLQKELVAGVGILALQLHNALTSQIKDVYATNRSLNSVLINKTSVDTKRGTNFIESGLAYRFEAINLSQFPSFGHFKGNINPDATKEGLVQTVLIVRKKGQKIIHGKKHYGGFVPSNAKGVRVGRWMLERQQKATWLSPGVRAPTKPLFGPSLTHMAIKQFNRPTGNVARFKNKLPELLIKYVNF